MKIPPGIDVHASPNVSTVRLPTAVPKATPILKAVGLHALAIKVVPG